MVVRAYQADTLRQVVLCYFRVLKGAPRSALMDDVMQVRWGGVVGWDGAVFPLPVGADPSTWQPRRVCQSSRTW